MFNAFARREAVEKLRKSLAEHETLCQEVEQASVRLFEQRQRAVAKVVEPVEDYVNRLARSPKEFDRSVREYRRAHSRFPGHALTPTGVMAIRCKQFHLPDL